MKFFTTYIKIFIIILYKINIMELFIEYIISAT